MKLNKHSLIALERNAQGQPISDKQKAKVVAYQRFLESQRTASTESIDRCKRILSTA